MNLLEGLRLNLRDMRHLGINVVARHLARIKPDRRARVNLRGIGSITMRAGDSDMEAVRQIFVEGDYNFAGLDAMSCRVRLKYESMLGDGCKPIIVDAGANIGIASLAFGAQFPEARIVAIEPDPENVLLLRENLEARPNCTVMEAAIGAERGFAVLHKERYSWATRTERAPRGVPIVTVEEAFAASGGDTPFIIKIDIEGFEKELFAANTEWLERSYAVVIEPHDWMLPGELSSETFQRAMSRHRFELFIRGENLLYVRA